MTNPIAKQQLSKANSIWFIVQTQEYIKNRLRLFNSPAPQSWGDRGFSFVTFSCIIDLWISYKESLQTIMKKLNILFIPEKLRWKISIRWSTAVILLLAVPCTVVRTAGTSNSFLSAVTAVFALHVATNMLWNAPPVCLSNSLVSNTAIAFLPLMKISAASSFRTDLSWTVSSIPSPV